MRYTGEGQVVAVSLAHVINVRHRELSSVYYIDLPMCQTPVTAVDTKWRLVAFMVAFNR